MKLGQLLKHLDTLACTADPELEIRGISYDSRKTQPGDLFVVVGQVRRRKTYEWLAAHVD